MPAIRCGLILSIVFLLLIVSVVDAQDRGSRFGPPKNFPPDGKLNDWGNGKPYSWDYSHLYDNEAQWLDNAVYYEAGKLPPGGDPNAPGGGEEPLNYVTVHPDSRPMGSGFNIVSALASYDPTYKGGTYWLAVDLPGPTNDLLSESFRNEYVFINYGLTLYPVPFDADCNEDKNVIDDYWTGQFGSIIGNLYDTDYEEYLIFLWVAGDFKQGWNYSGSPGIPYSGPGIPVVILMYEFINLAEPYSLKAYIPKEYLIDKSKDLNLLDVGGKILVFESSPDDLETGEYDIEVEINGIWKEILPLIDQNQLLQEVSVDDCGRAYIEFNADACDEADEEFVALGLNAVTKPKSPPPPWVRKAW